MRTRSLLPTTAAGVILLFGGCASAANAADAVFPAPAATALLTPAPAPSGGFSATGDFYERPVRPSGSDAKWKRQWKISLAPLFVSESLDAASSYGMRELNPLLAGGDGSFGMKATALKFGVVGALAGAEYVLVRKFPRSAKFFTIINWTTAGATTGLAVHNFELPR